MPTADQPITFSLSGKTALNRIYRSALSEYAASYDESDRSKCGIPSADYAQTFQDIADGGAGIICTGNIPIHRDYLENAYNAVLDPSNTWNAVQAFTPAIRAAKSRGALLLAQLQFPGRQCPININPNPKAPSDIQLQPCFNKIYGKPTALTIEEIKDLQRRYVWAAQQLAKAGADGVILHGCHGYLLTQFLSPRTNKRIDQYGGSLENRARFVLELIAALKTAMPIDKYLLAVKFNCQDFVAGGTTFAEACIVMKWLEDAGVDFFDISGGVYEYPIWRGQSEEVDIKRPSQAYWGSYFLEWAEQMKRILSRAAIGTTGGWRKSDRIRQAIAEDRVDMCGIARPLRDEPEMVEAILQADRRQSRL
ncbi:hypothetical protein EMMF5_006190 [Cystobasidiomycetes sp. EMM_F5]